MRGILLKNDTAVSESIGFILITGILVASLGIIMATGYPVYTTYMDNAHMQNIEDSFVIIAYNGNNVALLHAPTSSSELKVYGGNLMTAERGAITITCLKADGSQAAAPQTAAVKALEYSKGTQKVAYVLGSVCKNDLTYSVMLREPEIYHTYNSLNNPDTLSIQLIDLDDSSISFSGTGTTRLKFSTIYYSKMVQTVYSPPMTNISEVRRINVAIKSEYGTGLRDYFRDQLGYTVDTTGADGTVNLHREYPSDIVVYYMQNKVRVENV